MKKSSKNVVRLLDSKLTEFRVIEVTPQVDLGDGKIGHYFTFVSNDDTVQKDRFISLKQLKRKDARELNPRELVGATLQFGGYLPFKKGDRIETLEGEVIIAKHAGVLTKHITIQTGIVQADLDAIKKSVYREALMAKLGVLDMDGLLKMKI